MHPLSLGRNLATGYAASLPANSLAPTSAYRRSAVKGQKRAQAALARKRRLAKWTRERATP